MKKNAIELMTVQHQYEQAAKELEAAEKQVDSLQNTLYMERHLYIEDHKNAKRLTEENEVLRAKLQSLEHELQEQKAQTEKQRLETERQQEIMDQQKEQYSKEIEALQLQIQEQEENLKQLQLNSAVLMGRYKQAQEHFLSIKEQKQLLTQKYQKLLEDKNKSISEKIRGLIRK